VRHRRVGDGKEFVFSVNLFVEDLLRHINDLDHHLFHSILHVLFLMDIEISRSSHLIIFIANDLKINLLELGRLLL
jgi:hypothetical protein